MILALDTETTGRDWRHGARPFFVTVCNASGTQHFWEWAVDPLTRQVEIPYADLLEIRDWVDRADIVVGQNLKFDVAALQSAGLSGEWPWHKTRDTLTAGHLLASNQPHDLYSLAIHYLGKDLQPYETRLEKVVQECRRYCRSHLKDWQIANRDNPRMPSVPKSKKKTEKGEDRESAWKYDMWLPAALADEQGLEGDHQYRTILREYSNTDSAITVSLWPIMESELKRRDLWEIYLSKLQDNPIALGMEQGGVTLNAYRMDELRQKFSAESRRLGGLCIGIAESMGYDLTLPKSGMNNSLRAFCFGPNPVTGMGGNPDGLCLPWIKRGEKSLAPSLDKEVMSTLQTILPPNSPQLLFVRSLARKRALDKVMTDMDGYERFMLPMGGVYANSTKEIDRDGNGTASTYHNSARPDPIREGSGQPDPVLLGGLAQHGSGADVHSGESEGLVEGDPQGSSGCRVATEAGGYRRDEWYVLYPSMNPTGADTLRWSFSNPNSANIKKGDPDKGEITLRYLFGPAPGREWWCLDYENLELRIPAYESGEQAMIDLFERADQPPFYGSYHMLNASIVYPELFRLLAAQKGEFKRRYAASWYQWIKNAGFALIYGCQEAKFDQTARRKGAYRAIKSCLSKLFRLNDYYIGFAEKHGYVETLPDKTVNPRHGYPLLCTRTDYGRVLPTIPLNYHVSGTAMWITHKAMIRCEGQLAEWRSEGFDGRLVLQNHDELDFDFPALGRDANRWRAERLRDLMCQSGDDIGIPLRVSITYVPDNWSVGESL